MTTQFEEDIKKAHAFHGHICTGIVFGVRITRAGLHAIGIDDPSKNRDFIIYCEIDRCLTDALQSVTGVSLGRRRLKIREYGKMAASFVDMNSGKGVRVVCCNDIQMPDDADPVEFWSKYPDEELFRIEPVHIDIPPEDLPGRPVRSAVCCRCCEKIMDAKDVLGDGEMYCRPCAYGAYYSKSESSLKDLNRI